MVEQDVDVRMIMSPVGLVVTHVHHASAGTNELVRVLLYRSIS
jgi:hypothetical protein